MNDELELALLASADYSSNFDKIVQELRDKLSQEIGAEFVRIGDMNYSSSQTICLMLDEEHKPVNERRDAHFRINSFISSKGSFYAIGCRAKDVGLSKVWRIIRESNFNPSTESYIQQIAAVLEADGCTLLGEPILSQVVDNHRTRLDHLPATVFQVLFCELGQ